METKEYRFFNNKIEVRKTDDGKRFIEGFACRFNVLSKTMGWFREKIDPDAFKNTNMDDVVALVNHDSNLILGRNSAGTLTLEVRTDGLWYSLEVPDTTAGNDLVVSVERGDINGSSFAFEVNTSGDKWEQDENDGEIRTILDFKYVFDVSPVVHPAYPQTDVSVAKRSFDAFKAEQAPPPPEGPRLSVDLAKRQLEVLNLKSKRR